MKNTTKGFCSIKHVTGDLFTKEDKDPIRFLLIRDALMTQLPQIIGTACGCVDDHSLLNRTLRNLAQAQIDINLFSFFYFYLIYHVYSSISPETTTRGVLEDTRGLVAKPPVLSFK